MTKILTTTDHQKFRVLVQEEADTLRASGLTEAADGLQELLGDDALLQRFIQLFASFGDQRDAIAALEEPQGYVLGSEEFPSSAIYAPWSLVKSLDSHALDVVFLTGYVNGQNGPSIRGFKGHYLNAVRTGVAKEVTYFQIGQLLHEWRTLPSVEQVKAAIAKQPPGNLVRPRAAIQA